MHVVSVGPPLWAGGPKPVRTMGDVASPILQACPVGPDVHRTIQGSQASFWTLQLPRQLDIICTWEYKCQ